MLHPGVLKKRLPSLLTGFVVVAFCLGFVPPARGAPDDKFSAKAHYEAATRLYDVHEYEEALREYKAGYLAKPDPSFLFNIGQCYKRLGKPEQAREFFREYLKKAAANDPNRAQAEMRIREIENRDTANPSTPEASDTYPRSAVTPPAVSPGEDPAARAASEKSPALPFSAAPAIATGAEPAGVDLTASTSSAPDNFQPVFYRTWWFWTGVGAVVVAGTVTAVVLSRGGGNSPNVSGTTLGTRTVLQ
jgi:hypothetical protein